MSEATGYGYEDYYSSAIEALFGTTFPARLIQPLLQRVTEFSFQYGNCEGKARALNSCISGFDGENVWVDMDAYRRMDVGGDCVYVTGKFIESLTWEARNGAQRGQNLNLGTAMALQNVEIGRIECYTPWFFRAEYGYVHTACIIKINDAEILVDPSFGVAFDAKQSKRLGYTLLEDNRLDIDWLNRRIVARRELALPVYEYDESGLTKSGKCMILGTDDELMLAYGLGYMRDPHLRILNPFIQAIAVGGESFFLFNKVNEMLTIDNGFLSATQGDPLQQDLIFKTMNMVDMLSAITY